MSRDEDECKEEKKDSQEHQQREGRGASGSKDGKASKAKKKARDGKGIGATPSPAKRPADIDLETEMQRNEQGQPPSNEPIMVNRGGMDL